MKMKYMVAVILSCMLTGTTNLFAQNWVYNGNASAGATIGTTDGSDFTIVTTNGGDVRTNENVGIGTTAPQNRLLIENGAAYATPYSLPGGFTINGSDVAVYALSNNTGSDNTGVLSAIPNGDDLWNTAYVGYVMGNGSSSDNSCALFITQGNDAQLNEGVGVGIIGDNSQKNHGFSAYVSGAGSVNRAFEFLVEGDGSDNKGIDGIITGANTANAGMTLDVSGGTASNTGVSAVISGSGGTTNIGLVGDLSALSSSNTSYAVAGYAPSGTGSSPSGTINTSPSSNNWAGYFAGDVYSSGQYNSSDPSLKENVREYKGALTQLQNLPVKRYTFKTKEYPFMVLPVGEQIGIMSTDLKEVFPNLVKKTKSLPDPKTKTQVEFEAVNYSALIPVLVQASQELDGNDKKLQNKVDEQQSQIDDLNRQLTEMRAVLSDICTRKCEGWGIQEGDAPVKGVELYQSIPNPTASSTVIGYNIERPFNQATLLIVGTEGRIVKEYKITQQGKGTVVFDSGVLPEGTYQYSLLVDGQVMGAKSLMITRN